MAEVTSKIYKLFSNPIIYSGFQNLVGARRARQRLIKEFIKPFPGAKMLDMGCGAGDMLEYLPDDIKYTGFDIENNYIKHAKEKYGDRGKFVCAGIDEFTCSDHFDIVIVMGLLHHLNDEQAKKAFLAAKNILVKGGRMIVGDPVFIKNKDVIARFIISRDRGKNVRTPEGYLEIAKPVFSDIDSSVLTDLTRIPYAHFVMVCK